MHRLCSLAGDNGCGRDDAGLGQLGENRARRGRGLFSRRIAIGVRSCSIPGASTLFTKMPLRFFFRFHSLVIAVPVPRKASVQERAIPGPPPRDWGFSAVPLLCWERYMPRPGDPARAASDPTLRARRRYLPVSGRRRGVLAIHVAASEVQSAGARCTLKTRCESQFPGFAPLGRGSTWFSRAEHASHLIKIADAG